MKLFVFSLVSATLIYVIHTTTATCTSGQQCSSCEDSTGHCTTECFTGYYGPRCNFSCSEGCKDNLCKTYEYGIETCVTGCKAGFYGTRCSIPCFQDGECHTCPRECEDGFCQVDSRCVSRCEDSYYGTNCTSCGPDCGVCDRRTGICLQDASFPHTVYSWIMLTFGSGLFVFGMISIIVLAASRIKQLMRKSEQQNKTFPGQIISLDRTDDSADTMASGNGNYIHAIHNHYDECNEEFFA